MDLLDNHILNIINGRIHLKHSYNLMRTSKTMKKVVEPMFLNKKKKCMFLSNDITIDNPDYECPRFISPDGTECIDDVSSGDMFYAVGRYDLESGEVWFHDMAKHNYYMETITNDWKYIMVAHDPKPWKSWDHTERFVHTVDNFEKIDTLQTNYKVDYYNGCFYYIETKDDDKIVITKKDIETKETSSQTFNICIKDKDQIRRKVSFYVMDGCIVFHDDDKAYVFDWISGEHLMQFDNIDPCGEYSYFLKVSNDKKKLLIVSNNAAHVHNVEDIKNGQKKEVLKWTNLPKHENIFLRDDIIFTCEELENEQSKLVFFDGVVYDEKVIDGECVKWLYTEYTYSNCDNIAFTKGYEDNHITKTLIYSFIEN